ncbi:MAG: alkyl hydroperoxide reductase [Planctomycetaceae bacterium]|nr:alkyl hydroperoxide reductase [Planctomycetaceae bacterium]
MKFKLLNILSLILFAFQPVLVQGQDNKQDVKPNDGPAQEGAKATDENEENTAGPLAGHSYHGEAFNEGPRQQAYLIPGMANVDFPITTKNEEAQKFFNQGVSALHGFWYLEAERAFRQVNKIDPDCAMAFWGMSMANFNNSKRSKFFMEEAQKRKEGVTDIESRFIEALTAYQNADPGKKKERAEKYTKALEEICIKYPKNTESKAFLALQLWSNRYSDIPITSHVAIDSILQQIFTINPKHPSHHYRIHLWDYKDPSTAVTSASVCGQTTPGIAHMWHMPGHIFSRLKRYEDAVWQQEASARTDHAHMMRDRLLPDQIHNYAHNNEWCIRNMLHIGRVNDAINLSKNMTENPRHPKYNSLSRRGSSYYGRARLFTTLYMYERWQDMVDLSQTPYLEETTNETEKVKHWKYVGISYVMLEQNDKADELKVKLSELLAHNQTERTKAEEAAEKKITDEQNKDDKKKEADKKKAIDKAKNDARRPWDAKVRVCEQALAAITGYQHLVKDETKEAEAQLKKGGTIDRMILAKLQLANGDKNGALKTGQDHVNSHEHEVQPLCHWIELLVESEKMDRAKEAFDSLRDISGSIDLQSPVFDRVSALAASLGCDGQWKKEAVIQDDVGERVNLDDLGPFRWSPSPAEEFTLRDHRNKRFISAKEFNNKPTIVIFYLGAGCLSCTEQIQKFIPKIADFEEAGFQVIAVSSDDDEGLKQSINNFDGKISFRIVNDPELSVFKQYRAYDDFEEQPLHGTFIIDGNGLVRWQDVNYEPFMDPDFVLREGKRLLDVEIANQ